MVTEIGAWDMIIRTISYHSEKNNTVIDVLSRYAELQMITGMSTPTFLFAQDVQTTCLRDSEAVRIKQLI